MTWVWTRTTRWSRSSESTARRARLHSLSSSEDCSAASQMRRRMSATRASCATESRTFLPRQAACGGRANVKEHNTVTLRQFCTSEVKGKNWRSEDLSLNQDGDKDTCVRFYNEYATPQLCWNPMSVLRNFSRDRKTKLPVKHKHPRKSLN